MAFPSPTATFHQATYPSIDPMRPEVSAADKNVLITGGGGTIGHRIALAFATAGAAHIGLVGRTETSLAATKAALTKQHPSTTVHVLPADIADEAAIMTALTTFAAAVPRGEIDILVANAGHLPTPATLAASDAKDWWAGFTTNVLGGFYLLRAFLPHAARETGSVVLHVGTAATNLWPGIPGHSGYAAAKLAAARVFDYFGMENAPAGVRVRSFHPGVVESEMSRKTSEYGVPLPVDEREFSIPRVQLKSSSMVTGFADAKTDVLTNRPKQPISPATSPCGLLAPRPISSTGNSFGPTGMLTR
jgi:NAD(P)-dependent dehydrogenase (short-subunit alcohol dehydrogenase family)